MSELPGSWRSVPLTTVSHFIRGVTYTKDVATSLPAEGAVPILRANNLQGRAFSLSDLVYVPSSFVSEQQRVRAGDVVIATSSGSISVVGKAVQAQQDLSVGFGAFCGVLRPDPTIEPRYFGHYFSSDGYRTKVSALARGVNINNLKRDHFDALMLPLAPREEQQRIADKLDTVLARVDACRDRLARVAPLLKRFRQSVLAAATSGRLTEDWRELAIADWRRMRADEVCAKVQSGGTPKGGFTEAAGVPFLKVYNIVRQEIDFDYRPQFVHPDVHAGELRKSIALPGDVVMNIVGPPLGKVAVLTDSFPEWNINQAIALFRPSEQVTGGWLYILLCEGAPVRSVLDRTKGSVGQVNISLSQCRAFDFPVPSLDEQTEIVRRVDTLFAVADRLEARLAQAHTAVERLTPALLAKAFRGELVPQDPADEPAAELLQRLAAQREAAAAESGKKTSKVLGRSAS